jgi:hypothetical protein
MSFVAGVQDVKYLAAFLERLEKLTRETGVAIMHYERVQITTAGGAEFALNSRTNPVSGATEYVVEER